MTAWGWSLSVLTEMALRIKSPTPHSVITAAVIAVLMVNKKGFTANFDSFECHSASSLKMVLFFLAFFNSSCFLEKKLDPSASRIFQDKFFAASVI